jgi:NADPH:quinone reductase-like Zn-dependent oxidoreductase
VGREVKEWAVGDQVFGVTNDHFVGGYAQFALADAHRLFRRPTSLDAASAAAAPVVAVTAWQALFEEAKLRRGDKVLIHGAAGGVGGFAVQLAVAAGIEVKATATASNVGYVRDLGASEVIDHRFAAFERVFEKVDAVIDLVGGDTQTRSISVLKPGGTLVSAVAPPDPRALGQAGQNGRFFLVDVTTARLVKIAELLGAGALKVDIGEIVPMSRVQEFHERLDGIRPKPRGKMVLVPEL